MKTVLSCIPLIFALVLSGCAGWVAEEASGSNIDDALARSARRSEESHTLSRLAALERSVNDFIQAKGRIPTDLNDLIPEFIAEIPDTELGVPRGHRGKNNVEYYQAGIILDGQVNGALIKDSGGWGYVFNDRQVIIFVDCTHKRMDGSPWYQARGVY